MKTSRSAIFSVRVNSNDANELEPSGCSYEWVAQPTGACTGGTGTWMPGFWAPTQGCGATAQTRSVTCAFQANSGTQPVIVQCQRSDGTPANEANCDAGTRPSDTMASCTPVSEAVCGEAPETSRVEHLSNGCSSGCTPDSANHKFCVKMPI